METRLKFQQLQLYGKQHIILWSNPSIMLDNTNSGTGYSRYDAKTESMIGSLHNLIVCPKRIHILSQITQLICKHL